MPKIKLAQSEDALNLPEGSLVGDSIEVSFSTENVIECAKIVVENNDETEFATQAAVCAHAGNNYGWGGFKKYSCLGGDFKKNSHDTKPYVVLEKPDDALTLKKGGLVLFCFEVSFYDTNVIECAELIIKNKDETKFYTQAAIVAHAGNKYGWGKGEGYRTC